MKLNPIVLILCTICPLLLLAHVPSAHGQLPGTLGPDYIVDRFNQERRRIIRYAEVLGLNDRQSEKIDELSRHLEKEMVLQDARVEVIDIDLRAELSKDQVDMKQVRKLLAEKFEVERKRTEGWEYKNSARRHQPPHRTPLLRFQHPESRKSSPTYPNLHSREPAVNILVQTRCQASHYISPRDLPTADSSPFSHLRQKSLNLALHPHHQLRLANKSNPTPGHPHIAIGSSIPDPRFPVRGGSR